MDDDIAKRARAQADMYIALANRVVAGSLAAGLLQPGKHTPQDAVAMFREVLAEIFKEG